MFFCFVFLFVGFFVLFFITYILLLLWIEKLYSSYISIPSPACVTARRVKPTVTQHKAIHQFVRLRMSYTELICRLV